ncbi:MAG: MFS transporter [Planctomycetia bacterium]|nr:MFS transporter [Planctomycetia bacterium]
MPCIVLAESLGTSLWFCGTASLPEVTQLWSLNSFSQGSLLAVVQIGFILGTLGLSLTGLADAFPASRVFSAGCLLGSLANFGFAYASGGWIDAMFWRFLTGVALAGIYPLGMKLVITWMPDRTGEALGWLVGSVSLGTSLPFLLRALGEQIPWQWITVGASFFAVLAAFLMLWLGDGPAARPPGRKINLRIAWNCFRLPAYRASAFGYFGHMWELYAFWSTVPFLVRLVTDNRQQQSWWIFSIIAVGAAGNVLGGWWSRRIGSALVAIIALTISGCMCLLCPLLPWMPIWLVILFLVVWGLSAPADSPQFSALSAKACLPEATGSALALQNAIGFSVTVFGIQLTALSLEPMQFWIGWLWLPGPILGVLAMMSEFSVKRSDQAEPGKAADAPQP